MSQHYLVDGYNFIHHNPRLKQMINNSLEFARNQTIALIKGYISSRKIRVTLVFDGDDVGYVDPVFQNTSRLKIIYSNAPEKADPLIKRLIKKEKNKKSLTLVSADHELMDFGRSHGAKIISPENFYHLLTKSYLIHHLDQKYNHPLSPDELDEWLKLFGEKK